MDCLLCLRPLKEHQIGEWCALKEVMVKRDMKSWRDDVIAVRGHRCANCGDTYDIQIDHVIPRSQGGVEHIHNGLPLCGPWSKKSPYPNGCHQAKTDRKLLLTKRMLAHDQRAWLKEKGWIDWNKDGEPIGKGMKGFAYA